MKVLVAGAGSVGRSIARELLSHGHAVTLVDRLPAAMKIASVADADWLLADACEPTALADAGAGEMDVIVAATGDDKANLVISLLAKTEFAVPRVVARVNNPKNEWMFDSTWGVDVAVSTPRIMTALVEEAVTVGNLVKVFTFHQSGASIYEITLPADSPVIGRRVGGLLLPGAAVLAAIIRSEQPIAPVADDTLEARDQLLLVVDATGEEFVPAMQQALAPGPEAT
ncbi:MAG TPA: TrkA family potassium uptake protein [Actinomycetaceae bacterium]|nr:TrkA family potassium uptake protein [Actinomycetaceae bacterium]